MTTILVGTVAIIALLANDVTGVGIADDSLIPATAGRAMLSAGIR